MTEHERKVAHFREMREKDIASGTRTYTLEEIDRARDVGWEEVDRIKDNLKALQSLRAGDRLVFGDDECEVEEVYRRRIVADGNVHPLWQIDAMIRGGAEIVRSEDSPQVQEGA